MAGERFRVEPNALGGRLDAVGDALRAQTRADIAALPDAAKQGALGDAGCRAPSRECSDRTCHRAAHDGDRLPGALLVGLALANRDPKARLGFLDVLDVERHKLRATERAGKAKQQQGAVAKRFDAVPGAERHRNDALGVAGVFLRGAVPTLRRMPRTVAFTASLSVGTARPARLCA